MHEASLYDANCFLTLTYKDEYLPGGNSLCYRDFQRFMRRLRNEFRGTRIRFYMCGEYGERLSRPHFHACVFNLEFTDKVIFSDSERGKLFTSPTLSRLWPYGHATIGELTFESAAYVARYVTKKMTGDSAREHYTVLDPETGEIVERVPEFGQMSRRPGIGSDWLRLYWRDVYPRGCVVSNGHEAKAPRFYDKVARKLEAFEEAKHSRYLLAQSRSADNTDERLHVRERVVAAQSALLKRRYENG